MNNQAWIDILPPSAPAEEIALWLWLLLATISVILFVIIYRWYYSSPQIALRKISSIKSNLLKNKPVENKHKKEIYFEIRQALKKGFNVNSIHDINIEHDFQWNSYKKQLALACFSESINNEIAIETLLSDTQYWIKTQAKQHG